MLLLVVTLVSCNNQTKQSIIKTDDELSANIEHLFEKYVNNDSMFPIITLMILSVKSITLNSVDMIT